MTSKRDLKGAAARASIDALTPSKRRVLRLVRLGEPIVPARDWIDVTELARDGFLLMGRDPQSGLAVVLGVTELGQRADRAHASARTGVLRIGSRVEVVAEGAALWVGTVGVVAADDAAGVTLRVGTATVTVARRAVVPTRKAADPRGVCPGCGEPALDGKVTCGEVSCGSSTGPGAPLVIALWYVGFENGESAIVKTSRPWRLCDLGRARRSPVVEAFRVGDTVVPLLPGLALAPVDGDAAGDAAGEDRP